MYTKAAVPNVDVEVVSDSSVRVSWDRISLTEVTGYTVYYSETGSAEEVFVTVPNSADSVVIGDLLNDVEYQFQVAANIAPCTTITGQRSEPSKVTLRASMSSVQLGASVAGGAILVIIIAIVIVAIILVIMLLKRYSCAPKTIGSIIIVNF